MTLDIERSRSSAVWFLTCGLDDLWGLYAIEQYWEDPRSILRLSVVIFF